MLSGVDVNERSHLERVYMALSMRKPTLLLVVGKAGISVRLAKPLEEMRMAPRAFCQEWRVVMKLVRVRQTRLQEGEDKGVDQTFAAVVYVGECCAFVAICGSTVSQDGVEVQVWVNSEERASECAVIVVTSCYDVVKQVTKH